MKIALFGNGKMNCEVAACAQESGHTIVAIITRASTEGNLADANVAIDCSARSAVLPHIELCAATSIPLVIGTTGWEEEVPQAKMLVQKSQIGVLFAPNFSLGIYLFYELLKKAALLFQTYDMIGIETHHSQKKDAPSGTAKQIQKLFNQELTFHSIRSGTHPGKHEVIFDSPFDTIHLVHEARNKKGLAEGALTFAKWLIGKKGWFTHEDVYRSLHSTNHTL